MCRHLAYLGPPVTLRELLFDPPHSLLRQSWAPRDMRGGGTINADGFGIGWYPDGAAPVRYRRAQPIWSDPTIAELAAVTSAGAVLAAVRSATVGMAIVDTAAAPFTEGRWLFSHNGVVRGWPDSMVPLAAELPVRDLLTLDATTDSALLWALVRDRLRAGVAPARAVAETVTSVAAAAPGSRLNVLLTDGHTVVASAAGHALSLRATPASVLLVSEPHDDEPGWREVPDGQLVQATATELRQQALAAW
ncbi:ergothioneine biosynthesis protein EgtC [Verrucosispora sp. WMMA2044]|uniref:Gamma-glutamyl-hercynylcysteine sulfoxide hydrolase n=1 Tax=Verrucosispora sioxanthis TaxID=2499994 RepID=A0A6M1KTV6_9ACTN|nr:MULTISPECIES: ergothioneine biosynthesis protein EgtC [Micromonospora]NEE64318.1 ergothioneine biosynthesis protein EgtC [Verrucosispora sioxanthis]NGM13428.1 ergothioneine biosynthesis protein EgtC [Verrucosispora sioxanthis]WBB51405.1 ergothioneine biosynthesis protein EgtC [Verrucosispora sp. WMMA2044]